MWFKKKTVPKTNESKQIDVIQTWEVRWHSRHGQFHSDTRQEVEVFLSEGAANDFKESLENAFRLIKHTSGTRITIEQSSS